MKSNTLRSLRRLSKNTYIGKWKPKSKFIRTMNEEDMVVNMIVKHYCETIDNLRRRIDEGLKGVYHGQVRFKESIHLDVVARIESIQRETGKTVGEIANDIRTYTGKNFGFFRKVDGRKIPIDSDKIMAAYEAVKAQQPVIEIERILFKWGRQAIDPCESGIHTGNSVVPSNEL